MIHLPLPSHIGPVAVCLFCIEPTVVGADTYNFAVPTQVVENLVEKLRDAMGTLVNPGMTIQGTGRN